jgi:predicted membrane channel-forming protein YqfA (hemolysin III family)
MLATLLKIAYQLRHHCLGEWPLDRWAVSLVLIAAAIIPLRWLLLDRPQTPLAWVILVLLVGAAIGVSTRSASRGSAS